MKKLFIKRITVVGLISIMLLGFSVMAYADTSSGWTTKIVNGRSYKYNSETWNRYSGSNATLEAVANVKTSNGKNASSGYMGAQARLYTSNGTLHRSSSFVYNSSPAVNVIAYSSRTKSSGYFYAQSKIRLYNGDGYNTYTAKKSPNGTVSRARSSEVSATDDFTYSVNEFNETYGSGLMADIAGEEPDLISAIGTNGEQGYVRSEDLMPECHSIEDAMEASELAYSNQYIPLYNLNDEVIGEFELTGMDEEELAYLEEAIAAEYE